MKNTLQLKVLVPILLAPLALQACHKSQDQTCNGTPDYKSGVTYATADNKFDYDNGNTTALTLG